MLRTYRVKIGMVIWSITDNDGYITVKAFSADDALAIVRTRLHYRNYREDIIEDIFCVEGQA